jgi:hypothetical protein
VCICGAFTLAPGSAVAAPAPPVVATAGAKAVTATSATLTGTVNPKGQPTSYYFQYGTSTAYGGKTPSASAGSGTKNVNASGAVGSLAPSTTYHYRLVATNPSGTTAGGDRSFKTAKPSSGVTIAASPSSIVFGQATTLGGTVLGPGAAHAAVTLQGAAGAGGPFFNVATTTAGPKGTYSFLGVALSANIYFRALANGARSAVLLVPVHFRITLGVSTRHPLRGQRIRFHGRVAPRHKGLLVLIQRLGSHGRWHTLARTRLRSTSGNASVYSVRPRARRSGLYRAVVRPDAHHARGFSRVIRIRLH